MPKISVIISSYNHASYIGLAIESVLNQKFQDFEIIITDDASSDNTAEVVKAYLHDSRIKFFPFEKNREEHMKNYALKIATGDYIAILNSDDLFHSDKLLHQIEYLDSNPSVGACFTQVMWINEQGLEIKGREHVFPNDNKTRFEWLRHFFIYGNCPCHSSALIRKNLLDKIGFYNRWLASLSDFDLWIRICLETEIYIIPEVLTYNRLMAAEKNASGNRPDVFNRSIFELYKIMDHYFSDQMIVLLPKVFPEELSFKTEDIEKRKGLFSLYAIKTSSFASKFTGLDTFYSIIKNTSPSDLAKNFGEDIIQNYYKVISNTSIIPIQIPVIKVDWLSSSKEIINTSEIIVNYGILNTLYFNIPNYNSQISFKLSIDKAPFTIIIPELSIVNKKGELLEDLLPEMNVLGEHFIVIQDSYTSFLIQEFEFMLEETISLKDHQMGLFLKIAFRIEPHLKGFNIEGFIERELSRKTPILIEKELNERIPILLKNQNLEDISAKRLLSSLVKKLLKRIKVLT